MHGIQQMSTNFETLRQKTGKTAETLGITGLATSSSDTKGLRVIDHVLVHVHVLFEHSDIKHSELAQVVLCV